MAWLFLFIAGILECGWAIGLKYTDGFTRLWPSLFTILGASASFWLLAVAMRTIPVGTAYAVWTGIGVIGTALFGILFWNESGDWIRILCLVLITSGIIGLRLAG